MDETGLRRCCQQVIRAFSFNKNFNKLLEKSATVAGRDMNTQLSESSHLKPRTLEEKVGRTEGEGSAKVRRRNQ